MKRSVIVLLVAIGVGVALGATNEVDFSTYPNMGMSFHRERAADILKRFCEENNCKVVSSVETNLEWMVGNGKSVWVLMDNISFRQLGGRLRYLKFDSEGRLVATGVDFGKTAEFKAVKERCFGELQESWAKEHGMTVEEARKGYEKWIAPKLAERERERVRMQEQMDQLRRERESLASKRNNKEKMEAERIERPKEETKIYDQKFDKMLVELFGLRFGMSVGELKKAGRDDIYEMPKKFRHYSKIRCEEIDGIVYLFRILNPFDWDEYSLDSMKEEEKNVLKIIAEHLSVNYDGQATSIDNPRSSNYVTTRSLMEVEVGNRELAERLRKSHEAQKKQLPKLAESVGNVD